MPTSGDDTDAAGRTQKTAADLREEVFQHIPGARPIEPGVTARDTGALQDDVVVLPASQGHDRTRPAGVPYRSYPDAERPRRLSGAALPLDPSARRSCLDLPSADSRGTPGLLQQRLRHLDVLGHAEAAIHGDGFVQQLAGLVAVAGCVAVDEHAGVPAPHLRLLHHDG